MYNLQSVSKVFYDGKEFRAVLGNVSCSIAQDDFIAVLGESGSGKSTLLSLLALLDYPSSGTIRVDNTDTSGMSEAERIAWRSKNIGFIMQNNYLVHFWSVLDNVSFPLMLQGVSRKAAKRRASDALELVGISLNHYNDYPNTLSGGEKQRVSIARAVAQKPRILFADEPTGNLDANNAEQIYNVFSMLNSEGIGVVCVTHNAALSSKFQRVFMIHNHTLTEK